MSGGKKKVKVGYKYFMDIHFVLCDGPVDTVAAVVVEKDKVVWSGSPSSDGKVPLYAPNIFGKTAGGIQGDMYLHKGQGGLPPVAKDIYSFSSRVPGFKYVTSLFTRDLYVGNFPYLSSPEFIVGRTKIKADYTPQWLPEYASVGSFLWGYKSDYFLYFGLDLSDSMNQSVGGGSTRLDVAKEELIDLLDVLLEFSEAGAKINIKIQGWNDFPSASKTIMKLKRSHIPELETFIRGLNAHSGTNFAAGISPAVSWAESLGGDYLSGLTRFILYFITDGEPSAGSLAAAKALLNSKKSVDTVKITELRSASKFGGLLLSVSNDLMEVQGINIDLEDTTSTESLTGPPVPVVSSSKRGALVSAVLNKLQSAGTTFDINPIHAIRECLTDDSWGLGEAESNIDEDSFSDAARVAFNERLGFSFYWTQQGSILDFINNILVHINAVLVEDRDTGKIKVKLIRGDYDKVAVLELNATNVASVDAFKVPSSIDLASQVVVSYTDVLRNTTSTAVAHNTALQENNKVHKVEYNGVTRPQVARKLAERDMRLTSTPLTSCELTCTSVASEVEKGDVIKLVWPKYEVYGTYFRVTEVNYGDGSNNSVTLTCVQDVFSTPETTIVAEEEQKWEVPTYEPLAPVGVRIVEPSYLEMVFIGGENFSEGYESDESILSTAFVPANYEQKTLGVYLELTSDTLQPIGDSADYAASFYLPETLPWDATLLGFELPSSWVGGLAAVGDELMYVVSETEVVRGVADTLPQEHAVGALLISSDDVDYFEEQTFIVGEQETLVLIPETDYGEAAPTEWTYTDVDIRGRYLLPYPPAAVTLDGEFEQSVAIPEFSLAWETRNRLQQTGGTPISWFDKSSVTPEASVETVILIETEESSEIVYKGDLKEFDFSALDFMGSLKETNPRLVFSSVREGDPDWPDGLYSWKPFEIDLNIEFEEDEYWDYVVSLNHFDALDRMDVKGFLWATQTNNRTIAEKKFGDAAIDLSKGASTAAVAGLNFDQPFAIEFSYLQGTKVRDNNLLFSVVRNGVNVLSILEVGDTLSVRVSGDYGWDNGFGNAFDMADGYGFHYLAPNYVNPEIWKYISLTSDGVTARLFVDGEPILEFPILGMYPDSTGFSLGLDSPVIYLLDEADNPVTLNTSDAIIDELRVTCGAARYVAKYEPRRKPFNDSRYKFANG